MHSNDRKKEIIDVLSSELVKEKKKHKYFELKHEESVNNLKRKLFLDKYFFFHYTQNSNKHLL